MDTHIIPVVSLVDIPRAKYAQSYMTLVETIDESRKRENIPKFAFFRDSVVQRFEYTIESAWKYLKSMIEENDGLTDVLSPKKTIQEAYRLGYIGDIDTWQDMLVARNITSHDYGMQHSTHIYDDIDTYIIPLSALYATIRPLASH
jgi:nucleotidyltransferase substrate binding protein (TIGR01987 family)